MRFLVLGASPRSKSNTAALTDIFCAELAILGHEVCRKELYTMQIAPCVACRCCQQSLHSFGCAIKDDAYLLFDEVMACDVLVLASPIYSWYCTAPMKAFLDRMVYGMNKFYGIEKGPSLWQKKSLALITTCGYSPDKGADLWSQGMMRYAKHSQLIYKGMLAERHLGYDTPFMDKPKEMRARAFARSLCAES